jgi:hypothetical protein
MKTNCSLSISNSKLTYRPRLVENCESDHMDMWGPFGGSFLMNKQIMKIAL